MWIFRLESERGLKGRSSRIGGRVSARDLKSEGEGHSHMRSGTIGKITGAILLLRRGIFLLEQKSIGISSGGTLLKMLN